MKRSQQPEKQKNRQTISARKAAALALDLFEPKKANLDFILNKIIEKTAQKQRLTDLVSGSIRNLIAIDIVLSTCSDCPTKRIPQKILNILRIACYELIYRPQTPPYAVVNDAVENAKTKGKKHIAFVNAVLRKVTSHIISRQTAPATDAAKRQLSQNPSAACEFDLDLFPNPLTSPADYLSAAFSLPKWLVTDWLKQFHYEKTYQLCLASNRSPSLYLRPNTLKTTPASLADKLKQAGFDATIIDETMLQIKNPGSPAQLPGFADGLFTIQDLASASVVKLLSPKPNWTILDLCSAPGTKTTQLAEITKDCAKIFATDIDINRLKLVEQNIRRLNLKSITIFKYQNLEKIAKSIAPFDCVLLDVPCSNTAVLAKRPDVRLRITEKAIAALSNKQLELLQNAAGLIKSGGIICYSTCSIQKEENDSLVRRFLETNPNFTLESEKLILPSALFPDHDGCYTAILTMV